MGTPEPLVSIGMPVYNAERFLAAAIESVLAQDFDNLELVISDNGSSDGSPSICADYAARDPRVRFERHGENRGAAWNFNRVFTQSTGTYFKWACSDDVLAPTLVSACVRVFERESATVVACVPATALIDEAGDLVPEVEWVPRWQAPPDGDLRLDDPRPHVRLHKLLDNLKMGNALHGLFRSTALRQTRLHGAFDSSDRLLLAEVALIGEWREVAEPLFLRRVHSGMSRIANPTTREVAQFFDPTDQRRFHLPWSRLFVEHLRSIRHLPIAPADKARVTATLLREWYWRSVARDFREAFGQLVRGTPATTAEGARLDG